MFGGIFYRTVALEEFCFRYIVFRRVQRRIEIARSLKSVQTKELIDIKYITTTGWSQISWGVPGRENEYPEP